MMFFRSLCSTIPVQSMDGSFSPEQNPAENLSHKPPWYTSMLNYVFWMRIYAIKLSLRVQFLLRGKSWRCWDFLIYLLAATMCASFWPLHIFAVWNRMETGHQILQQSIMRIHCRSMFNFMNSFFFKTLSQGNYIDRSF